MKVVTVIGAGNSGLAMAAHLSLSGNRVKLWNRSLSTIEELVTSKTIDCKGVIRGKAPIDLATTNMEEAIADCDCIFVTTPAHSHVDIARTLAPCLTRDIPIVLNPGRTFGALEFAEVLSRAGCKVRPKIAETQTTIYTCRKTGPSSVSILAMKHQVLIAALPPADVYSLISRLPSCIRQHLSPAESMIDTSIGNVGMIFHCAPVLFNIGWIESPEVSFYYYHDGISHSIARLLEKLDRERLAVAAALGKSLESVQEWLKRSYGVKGDCLYDCLRQNTVYRTIKAPSTLRHRYIFEDVPCGLVPLEAVGKLLGLPMKLTGLIVDLACEVTQVNFRAKGRNLARLGLVGKGVNEVIELLYGGLLEEDVRRFGKRKVRSKTVIRRLLRPVSHSPAATVIPPEQQSDILLP